MVRERGAAYMAELGRRGAAARKAAIAARTAAGDHGETLVEMTVLIRADQAERLRKVARSRRVSRSAIIREALDLWLTDVVRIEAERRAALDPIPFK